MGERGAQRGGPGWAGRGAAANRSAGFGWPVAGGERAHGRAFLERGGAAGHCGKVADRAPMAGRAAVGPDPPVTGPSAEPPPPLALCGPAVGPRRAGRALAAAGMAAQGGPGPRALRLVPHRSEPSAGAWSGPGPGLRGPGPAQPADPASPAAQPAEPSRERPRPRRAGPVLQAPLLPCPTRAAPSLPAELSGCHLRALPRFLFLHTEGLRAGFVPAFLTDSYQVPHSQEERSSLITHLWQRQLKIIQQTEALSTPRIKATGAAPCDLVPFGAPMSGQS
ncbi:transcription initiation factor TFIID subunit 4-like [Prinia subflava]|uniref:transcription initiation factor TFIID subunit 4-like n=1 Tax=Prinia subflava TaxID=208062 RepID=UPI002FE1B5E4